MNKKLRSVLVIFSSILMIFSLSFTVLADTFRNEAEFYEIKVRGTDDNDENEVEVVVVDLINNKDSETKSEHTFPARRDDLNNDYTVLHTIGNDGSVYMSEENSQKLNDVIKDLKASQAAENKKQQEDKSDTSFKAVISKAKGSMGNIKSTMTDDITADPSKGSAWLQEHHMDLPGFFTNALSVLLWILWAGFLTMEIINGACILFPVFRNKVTGEGTNYPWFLTVNTITCLKNVDEEPFKPWAKGEVKRVVFFIIISIGLISGLIYTIIDTIMNLLK